MGPPSFLMRSKSDDSFLSILSTKEEKSLLPAPVHRKPKIRVRTLLGHCLYRRVILWTAGILFLLCLALSSPGGRQRRQRLMELVDLSHQDVRSSGGEGEAPTVSKDTEGVIIVGSAGDAPQVQVQGEHMPTWLRFRHLDGFFNGLKALVPANEHIPEYPRKPGEASPFPLTLSYTGLPTPTPYISQPDYESPEYISQYHAVEKCYLDKERRIPVPDLYAYNGVVQGQPEPAMGSRNLLGLRDDVCFDRFGRYGPYGLGYSFDEGGAFVGTDTEQEGSSTVWEKTGKINYENMDWGDAQTRCYESNKKRFADPAAPTKTAAVSGQFHQRSFLRNERQKIPRTAVVIRAYVGFQWTQHNILNFRALISELALKSGGEYAVHFLLHVRNNNEAIWADPMTAQRILDENIPQEFHGLCTLWSEAQMRLYYPGKFGGSFQNPSGGDIHGVYRSAHFPLQHFAMQHPEYEYFWNWELDMRWLGNYYELFDRLSAWAKEQPRNELWERSAKYYIPSYHGSWENFTSLVHNETLNSGREATYGPVQFPGRQPLRSELRGESFMPSNCDPNDKSDTKCGKGEEADLITLNPLFDTEHSGWVFSTDVTGYKRSLPLPPRRCSIITASRLSRRLLNTMHEETWRLKHTMFAEMYPATMALHHGLKAVYAPHPVYLDREWEIEAIDKAFNGGRDHTAGGHGSPFDLNNEHNHKGSSWYYNSEFAGLLWRRWLGYAQFDGRGRNGGRSGEGQLRGGKEEEERAAGTGRLCLRSMLVHPIKWEHPSELD
ncbi:hypothetical protein QC762_210120 [Podospora pseudocomata]|uniref:Major facilitator superfamily transporter n=1 Tax=Podospora pseudocomata TaxID=2093779 RepID=A0ABR0GN14_9PEZI|nr:hypothetical protein QC762_210120 [Podospora pseudocomata]